MERWLMVAPQRSSRESISQWIQEILTLPDHFAIDDLIILIRGVEGYPTTLSLAGEGAHSYGDG